MEFWIGKRVETLDRKDFLGVFPFLYGNMLSKYVFEKWSGRENTYWTFR